MLHFLLVKFLAAFFNMTCSLMGVKDRPWTRGPWTPSLNRVNGPGPFFLPIQKVSQTFMKANLRPKNFCLGLIKNFCLGLIRPKVSFYKCLGYFL